MGDISTEPSMEDILSSIKRIIAEENEASPVRAKKPARVVPRPDPEPFDHDEILELIDPAPGEPEPVARPPAEAAPTAPQTTPQTTSQPVAAEPAPLPNAETLLSPRAAEASRGPLDALSRLVVKSDAAAPETLEGLVRDMLRPLLREWLDAHLPAMVETMVAREIERITGK